MPHTIAWHPWRPTLRMGGVMFHDGTELKAISGIDDHSRFCVIAKLHRSPLSDPT
jgi:hypothetical protein